MDREQIAAALRGCARQRAAEEACRLAVHRLWELISESAGRVQKRVPSPPAAAVYADPAGWRESLINETRRIREAGGRTQSEGRLEDEAVSQHFDEQYEIVTATDYLSELEFLFDFDGKDLLKQFRQWLDSRGVHLGFEKLRDQLTSSAVGEYALDRTIYGTDDFLDLANGVRKVGGLPAIN
jgi:hypothetical protein